MKRVIVTAAGRQKYLDILWKHLKAQRESFDEWHLWLNTTNPDDLKWMQELAAQEMPGGNPIRLIDAHQGRPQEGCWHLYRFYDFSADPSAVYLKLDDDFVWLEPGFLDNMFSRREADKETFLYSANVVNNPICSHLVAQQSGIIHPCGYHGMDPIGWRDGAYAAHVHSTFLSSLGTGDLGDWKIKDHVVEPGFRYGIGSVSWRGDTFSKFPHGVCRGVRGDDEDWLTCVATRVWGPVIINGSAICVHFSFGPQKKFLDSTDLLDKYRILAEDL